MEYSNKFRISHETKFELISELDLAFRAFFFELFFLTYVILFRL